MGVRNGVVFLHHFQNLRNDLRIGALASVPTESDCRFLEHPPAVPPLKIYSVIYRPGRPKKGTVRPTDKALTPPSLELPHEIELPRNRDSE